MEDFHYAGGLPALLARARRPPAPRSADRQRGDARREPRGRERPQRRRDRDAREAAVREGGLAVLRGNLAPRRRGDQASAVSRGCGSHTRAGDRVQRLQRPRAAGSTSRARATPTRCWCCRTPGRSADRACPSGACCRSRRSSSAGRARHACGISDARMSGTSYGACVLHVAPESFVGGPLALVKDGDLDRAGCAARRLELKVTRRSSRAGGPRGSAPAPRYVRGYGVMYAHTSARPTRAVISTTSRGPPRPRARDPLSERRASLTLPLRATPPQHRFRLVACTASQPSKPTKEAMTMLRRIALGLAFCSPHSSPSPETRRTRAEPSSPSAEAASWSPIAQART